MNELVYLYRTENYDYAKDLLDQMYTPAIMRLINAKYKNTITTLQLTSVDVRTLCAKALLTAIKNFNYNSKEASSFKTYYGLLAIRQMQAIIHQNASPNAIAFATRVSSLDVEEPSQEQIAALSYEQPRLDEYQTESLDFLVRVGLTEHERWVLDLKLYGYKNQEIAVMLASKSKTVANTYERAKRRMRSYLEKTGYKFEDEAD